MNRKFTAVSNIRLAEFAADYYRDYHSKRETDGGNDCQSEFLSNDVMESEPSSDENVNHYLPHTIRLMSKNETMKCRKVKAVLRFHRRNKVFEHEKYCHHLPMSYYPWRNEVELLGPGGTYPSKLNSSAVAERVGENRSKFEVDSDEIDEAFEYARNNPTFDNFCGNLDAINEQENFDSRETIDSIVKDDVNELDLNNDQNTLLPEPSTSTDNQTTIPMSSLLRYKMMHSEVWLDP